MLETRELRGVREGTMTMVSGQRMQQVGVLGLGRFGRAVARELTRLGHEVLGVDRDERVVEAVMTDLTQTAQADVTDERALRELGLGAFDTAIVAVSGSLEASILGTVLCRRLGVRRVIATAGTALHGAILEQVGATRVVYPEEETGVRVARSFAAPAVQDYLDVAPGYGIARVEVTASLNGRRLDALARLLAVPEERLTPIALVRGSTVLLNPGPEEVVREGDALILAGRDADLERLPGRTDAPGDSDAPQPPD
jgi:trk system potassium uptake protein